MDLVERIGWNLGLSGLGAIVAAAVCQMTGASARTSSGASVNTHTPATWVLGTIALILVVNSLGLLGYAKERKTPASAPDSG
jgi:hypothetical protein